MSIILDWLFPKFCFNCHSPGIYFCSQCLEKEPILSPKYFTDPDHEGTLSLFKYHLLIKQGIINLKYHFVTDLVDEFSLICSERITKNYPHVLEYWQKNNFTIIPIPLHPNRLNWRGFNQSELLSKKIADNLNLKYSNNLLVRSRNTSAQVKFKFKSSRINNMKEAFELNIMENITIPQNIILFDDVITTGSTLLNALKIIKTCGPNHCWFLTIAR